MLLANRGAKENYRDPVAVRAYRPCGGIMFQNGKRRMGESARSELKNPNMTDSRRVKSSLAQEAS